MRWKHTPLHICFNHHRFGSSRASICEEGPLSTNQTPANSLLYFQSTTLPPPPPRLPPIVTRFVFLPLRPSLSGLDGHHYRGEVRFIHGEQRRPSPGKGAEGTGKRANTSISILKLGNYRRLARPGKLSTCITFILNTTELHASQVEVWVIHTFPGAHCASSSPQQEQAARQQQPVPLCSRSPSDTQTQG